MQFVAKKRIGILRGGPSPRRSGLWPREGGMGDEYSVSLKKGGEIITYITENLGDKYKPVDILIDQDYIWHMGGRPITPGDLAHRVDIVWNLAHPSLSNILESLAIPNVGINFFTSSLANSWEMLREHIKKISVEMPRHIILPVYQKDFDGPRERYAIKKAKEVFEKFGAPWIVNPVVNVDDTPLVRGVATSPTSTIRVKSLAHTFNELVAAIEDGVNHKKSISVEEFISGKIVSMHSVADFRGEDIYIFPPRNVFGNFSAEEKEKLINLVRDLHTHLGARHYLKVDFILNPRGKIYLFNIDGTPNLKPGSHFSKACESVGVKLDNIVEHILESALSVA